MFAGVVVRPIETCPISNKQYGSLDFALNGCFRKIFRPKSAEVVQNCVQMYSCFPVYECVAKRGHKFLVNYITSDDSLSYMCKNNAARELNMLRQPRLFLLI